MLCDTDTRVSNLTRCFNRFDAMATAAIVSLGVLWRRCTVSTHR